MKYGCYQSSPSLRFLSFTLQKMEEDEEESIQTVRGGGLESRLLHGPSQWNEKSGVKGEECRKGEATSTEGRNQ